MAKRKTSDRGQVFISHKRGEHTTMAMVKRELDTPTVSIGLKAPVEFWQQLDAWREWTAKRDRMTMAPSRPAAIRWIVYQFLTKQGQRAARRSK